MTIKCYDKINVPCKYEYKSKSKFEKILKIMSTQQHNPHDWLGHMSMDKPMWISVAVLGNKFDLHMSIKI